MREDIEAIRERIAAELAAIKQRKSDDEPARLETYDEYVDRREGREAAAIARRMFRH